MKKYYITYPIVGGVAFFAALIYFGFVVHVGVVPTMWMCVGCPAITLSLARVVLHLAEGDNAIKTWQQNVYAIFGTAGWICAAFSQSYRYSSLFTMIAVSFATVLAGTYMTDVNGDGIPDVLQDPKKIYTEDILKANLIYKFKGDVLGAKADKSRPVCVCNGRNLTVAQAVAEGFIAEAEEAMKYIVDLFK